MLNDGNLNAVRQKRAIYHVSHLMFLSTKRVEETKLTIVTHFELPICEPFAMVV